MKANRPLVSIGCITYNHEKFIRQTLDGFLSQKTDFSFEILIHDDASTDKTADIIRDYEKRYPTIIKPIYQTENQYSKGKNITFTYQLPRAKGRYIALCEGDDYWSDTTKLQRQVDFLEKNESYALVFHPVRVFFEDKEKEDSIFPEDKSGFTQSKLIERNFIQTNSVMYRSLGDYSSIRNDVLPGDWYLHLYHAQFGKIGFIDRVMSAYRRHKGGIWWQTTGPNRDDIWKNHGIAHLRLYIEMMGIYGSRREDVDVIDNHIEGTVSVLNRIDEDQDTRLIDSLANSLGDSTSAVIASMARVVRKKCEQIDMLNDGIEEAEGARLREVSELKKSLELEKRGNREILNSWSYKIGNSLLYPYRLLQRITKRGKR